MLQNIFKYWQILVDHKNDLKQSSFKKNSNIKVNNKHKHKDQ